MISSTMARARVVLIPTLGIKICIESCFEYNQLGLYDVSFNSLKIKSL